MVQYRFKTKKEFETVHGSAWRDNLGVWFSPEMDKFFGTKLDAVNNSLAETCVNSWDSSFTMEVNALNFSISPNMLVELAGSTIIPEALNPRLFKRSAKVRLDQEN